MEEPSGNGRRAAPRVGAALAALAAMLFPATVGAAERPAPPTAIELERATDAALGEPRPLGGGIGEEPPIEEPAGPDAPLLGGDRIAVALYGAPQLTATAVGKRTAQGAARKLRRQARPYRRSTARPVSLSINLIGVIATASPGGDGRYRARQPDEIIRRYLKAARSVGARLTLDIQPGRSPVKAELRALRRWIALPDVDVGIDPEWNVGPRGVPGRTEGSISARDLNRASAWIADLVAERELPDKAMIVHQFRTGSVRARKRLRSPAGVDVALNFDGIGGRAAKRAGYARLASEGLFSGFSLFYDRDVDLLGPRAVLRLDPEVDYAMYQ